MLLPHLSTPSKTMNAPLLFGARISVEDLIWGNALCKMWRDLPFMRVVSRVSVKQASHPVYIEVQGPPKTPEMERWNTHRSTETEVELFK